MIKSLVVAAALTIGLAGYAVAQEAAPAPAAPMEHHHAGGIRRDTAFALR